MIIEQKSVQLIPGTPMGIRLYKVGHEEAHYHSDCIEILFCLEGTVTMKIAYEDFTISPGEIILIDAEDVHCISSGEDNLLMSFYIDQTDDIFKGTDLVNMSFVCHKGEIHPSMEPKIDEITIMLLAMLYVFMHKKYSDERKADIIRETAVKIMRTFLDSFSIFYWMNDPNQFPEDTKARFEDIFTYIYNNSTNRITIEELGQREHINPNYLSQFLKKTSFLGLRGLRTYVRVYKAELMLLTTDHNISEISYMCGFSDPKYFHRAFKNWYHHTPLMHRKLYRSYMNNIEPSTEYSLEEKADEIKEWIIYYQSRLQLKLFGIDKTTSPQYKEGLASTDIVI